MYLNRAFICCMYVFFLPHWKALEKQGAERAQQKAQEKSFTMNSVNTSYTYHQGAGRGLRGRGGGVGPVRGGGYTPGHTRKPYDKPMHAVQQPSPSGPIGAKDFATYPEPLIGELIELNSFMTYIHYLHKSHNTPLLPPKNLHRHCFSTSLGTFSCPRRNCKQW